jgi:peptidoglycan/LPS O-acetylase OafA/YrhL
MGPGLLDAPLHARRSPAIDQLRGVLACWVLLAHLVPWAVCAQGADAVPGAALRLSHAAERLFQPHAETHPAVLCFIVLSGYCIHRNGWRRKGGSVPAYACRRFFRITPVFLLATLAGAASFPLCVARAADVTYGVTVTTRIAPELLLAKVLGLAAVYPRLLFPAAQANAPLHTVMVEDWLYATYPLLVVLVLRRSSERALWALILAVWVGGVALMTWSPGLARWWHTASLPGFLLYWWIGAKCVDANFAARLWRGRFGLLLAWGLLTLAVLGPGWPALVECRKALFACLAGAFIARVDARPLLEARLLEEVGKAGYSLYALHAPLIFTLLLWGAPWWAAGLAAVAAGLAVFHLYEKRLTQLGKRLLRPRPGPAAEEAARPVAA